MRIGRGFLLRLERLLTGLPVSQEGLSQPMFGLELNRPGFCGGRRDAKVEKGYLYPKPMGHKKSIDGLAALVELDIKVAVFDPCSSSSTTVRAIG